MNAHNEHNVSPGTYRHHKGDLYVVTDLVTHMDNPATGKMEELPRDQKLVVYRDLMPIMKHINGRPQPGHQVYARTVKEFEAMIDGKPRFTQQ